MRDPVPAGELRRGFVARAASRLPACATGLAKFGGMDVVYTGTSQGVQDGTTRLKPLDRNIRAYNLGGERYGKKLSA